LPLPIFNYKGRLYALKLTFRCLVSPLVGVEFVIEWMTDQWISMATPLRDVAYTACYYTNLNFDLISVNPCKSKNTFEVVLLVVLIVQAYRIMQCIRMGYQEGKYIMTPHMANTLKYILSLASAVISYVYNLGYTHLLWLWVVISVISTLYSYMYDLKMAWGLLETNSKNWLLRKYLTFESKRNYYLVIAVNFLMRFSWTLTLSPSIAAYFGNPSLLTLVTGCIEIIRRGIWNLLRLEKEHLKNCN
jgi:xenotropic and polytropic retrovirus receptor 1